MEFLTPQYATPDQVIANLKQNGYLSQEKSSDIMKSFAKYFKGFDLSPNDATNLCLLSVALAKDLDHMTENCGQESNFTERSYQNLLDILLANTK